MSNATLEYFEEYRQKIAEADRLYKRERELRREAEQIQQHRQQIREDIANMGRLITAMIENDWDPVEAKLKTESEERQRSFWDTRSSAETISSAITAGLGLGVSANTAYGMTGATGAIGMGAMGVGGGASYGCNNYLGISGVQTITLSGAQGSSYTYPVAKGANGGTGTNYP